MYIKCISWLICRLLEPEGTVVIGSFKLYTILFCVRGADDSIERDCFAFTESHQQSGIFQCHVFRCDVPEAVSVFTKQQFESDVI